MAGNFYILFFFKKEHQAMIITHRKSLDVSKKKFLCVRNHRLALFFFNRLLKLFITNSVFFFKKK